MINWRKSSYSGSSGQCVEAGNSTCVVLVRDTNDRAGITLEFTLEAWSAFTAGLR